MYNLSDAALYSTLEANINKVIKLKVNENSSDHPPFNSGPQLQILRSSGQILKCCIWDPKFKWGEPRSNCNFPFPFIDVP